MSTETAPPPPGWMKKGLNLSKGVQKFVQYNSDLMPPDKLDRVKALHARFTTALHHRNEDEVKVLEKELISSCEGAVPNYKSSAVKENIEVIVVAIVVALGIRAYFLQPFKIPTASMQPTLNGIIAQTVPDTQAFPNPVVRGFEYLARGRNYVEMRVPADWGTVQMVGIRQRSLLHFFTMTDLIFVDAARRERVLTGYVPARQLWESLWVGPKPAMASTNELTGGGGEKFEVKVQSGPIPGGTLIGRGVIDTGDQVLVNKMAYHFRRPTRGEVFVFGTSGIKGILPPPGIDSQHYIKRLTALPGDKVQLVPTGEQTTNVRGDLCDVATLQINGAPAAEAGMQKVMGRQNGYKGYSIMDLAWGNFLKGTRTIQLDSKEYLAMGDNSPDSSDSRVWGPVPEKNLVGPALTVYWPFLPHFGLIR
jgi:signal peptidase I